MASEPIETGNGKARKRPAAKTASRPVVNKVKATLHITAEASTRLTIHATMLGVDRSELVESLIQLHLRRFVVSDRGGGDGTIDGIPESGNA